MAITAASILRSSDQRQQPRGQVLDDRDRRLRQVADQRRQRVRQQIGADGRNDADPQRSGERVARAARRRGDFGDRRQRAPGVLDDRLGARRDGDRAPLALEDAHAEFRLQLEDLAAQRRLADVAGRRGAAEMTVVGDGDDILEIAQVHGLNLHNRLSRLQIDQQSIGPIELVGRIGVVRGCHSPNKQETIGENMTSESKCPFPHGSRGPIEP